jgi:hypothetical protein
MNESCAGFGDGLANPSASELEDVLHAVDEQAASARVDKRFVLAIMVGLSFVAGWSWC